MKEEKKKKKTGIIIGAVFIVLLVAIGIVAFLFSNSKNLFKKKLKDKYEDLVDEVEDIIDNKAFNEEKVLSNIKMSVKTNGIQSSFDAKVGLDRKEQRIYMELPPVLADLKAEIKENELKTIANGIRTKEMLPDSFKMKKILETSNNKAIIKIMKMGEDAFLKNYDKKLLREETKEIIVGDGCDNLEGCLKSTLKVRHYEYVMNSSFLQKVMKETLEQIKKDKETLDYMKSINIDVDEKLKNLGKGDNSSKEKLTFYMDFKGREVVKYGILNGNQSLDIEEVRRTISKKQKAIRLNGSNTTNSINIIYVGNDKGDLKIKTSKGEFRGTYNKSNDNLEVKLNDNLTKKELMTFSLKKGDNYYEFIFLLNSDLFNFNLNLKTESGKTIPTLTGAFKEKSVLTSEEQAQYNKAFSFIGNILGNKILG